MCIDVECAEFCFRCGGHNSLDELCQVENSPIADWVIGSSVSEDRKKCPPAQPRALGLLRYETSLCRTSTMSLLM